jgi:hypothetical protein
MRSTAFERFAAGCAILAGLAGFLYAVSFIVIKSALPSSLFLTLLGLLSTPALVALYYRLRQSDAAFATWALVLALAGAVGTAVHGGYDLAYNVNVPANPPPADIMALPSQVDPRGLLAFGVAGAGLFVLSWLMVRSKSFSIGLGYLGYLSAVLLVILYLGRLIVLDPSQPVILIPAILNGFIVSPIWYVWLGIALWHPARVVSPAYQGSERRMGERRQVA